MKISVIMVCFNSQASIRQAIDSFLEQDHADRELLVIDGQSRDRTCEIVESYGSPLISLASEPDEGIYDAMNKGLTQMTGDGFGFLNSDDCYYDRSALSQIAGKLHDADLVTGTLRFVKEHDGSAPVRVWRTKKYQAGGFKRGWSPPHPTTYARREVYERLGPFVSSYRSAGDYDWFLRALELEGFSHEIISGSLVNMKIGGVSTSGFGALWQNSTEQLHSRRQRLDGGLIDLAVFKIIARKAWQFVERD